MPEGKPPGRVAGRGGIGRPPKESDAAHTGPSVMALRIDDLTVFLMVAREGSVSRAALALNRAQQTISERVTAVERTAGHRLFVRSPRGMELTTAGRRFVPYAEQCIAQLEQGISALHGEGGERSLRVSVHVSAAAAAQAFLGRAMEGFELVVTRHRGRLRSLIRAVAGGETDLAAGPFNGVPDEVVARPFGWDPVVCVVPPSSPLAEREEVWLDELAHHLASVDVWGDGGESLLLPGRFNPDGRGAGPGGGPPSVLVCARSAVAAAVAGGELVELVVPDLPQWSRELKVAYRREDAHQPQIRVLEAALEALRVSGGDPHPTVEAAR